MHVVNLKRSHNHAEEQQKVMRRNAIAGMKNKVLALPDKSVRQVYQEVLTDTVSELQEQHPMEEIGAAMPTLGNVKTVLFRERATTRPTLPGSLAEIVLSVDMTRTRDNATFLTINDGSVDRILGFCSDEALEILCSATTIYMDGTFKVVPSLFYQLYTLHGMFEGEMMPLAYFLLPRKDEETYVRMFNLLRTLADSKGFVFRPPKFQIDFETAVLKAIDDCFPAAEVKGCTFHFTQAVWRNLQRLGLMEFYKTDQNVKM